MYIEKEEPENFEPLNLVLETQDEVNILYALINFIPIIEALSKYSEGKKFIENLMTELDCHYTSGYLFPMTYLERDVTWTRKPSC